MDFEVGHEGWTQFEKNRNLPEGNAYQGENMSKVSACSHIKRWSSEFYVPFPCSKNCLTTGTLKNRISGWERPTPVSLVSLKTLVHRLLEENKDQKLIKIS